MPCDEAKQVDRCKATAIDTGRRYVQIVTFSALYVKMNWRATCDDHCFLRTDHGSNTLLFHKCWAIMASEAHVFPSSPRFIKTSSPVIQQNGLQISHMGLQYLVGERCIICNCPGFSSHLLCYFHSPRLASPPSLSRSAPSLYLKSLEFPHSCRGKMPRQVC